MAQTGHPQRRRRRGRPVTYDPASNQPWRTTARFTPDTAKKIFALKARISDELPVDEMLNLLTSLVPTDPGDPPLTAERIEQELQKLAERFGPTDQEELPLVS
ncbi:hypothetical protein [Actinomadura fulvescens]